MQGVNKAELISPSDIQRLGKKFTSVSNTGENSTRTKYLILMVKNLKATDKKLQLFENW